MPETKSRRKSVFRRLRLPNVPLLGRLRRRSKDATPAVENDLRSPTSVADLWQGQVPVMDEPSKETNNIHIIDNRTDNAGNKENIRVASDAEPEIAIDETAASKNRGVLLRDFSYPNTVNSNNGRDNVVFSPSRVGFHRVSPMNWESDSGSSFEQMNNPTHTTVDIEEEGEKEEEESTTTYFTPVQNGEVFVDDSVALGSESESEEFIEPYQADAAQEPVESNDTDSPKNEESDHENSKEFKNISVGSEFVEAATKVPSVGCVDDYAAGETLQKQSPPSNAPNSGQNGETSEGCEVAEEESSKTETTPANATQDQHGRETTPEEGKPMVEETMEPEPYPPKAPQNERNGEATDSDSVHPNNQASDEMDESESIADEYETASENEGDGDEATEKEMDSDSGQPTDKASAEKDAADRSTADEPEADQEDTSSTGTTPTSDESSTKSSNPEELFNQGETVIVDITGGAYKKYKAGKIVAIAKSVKIFIEDKGEHWLARKSLAYMGEAFPAYADAKTSKPTSKAASSESEKTNNYDFQIFERVNIIKGTYAKFKTGTVVEVKSRVKVKVDDVRSPSWLNKESLQGTGIQDQNPPSDVSDNGEEATKAASGTTKRARAKSQQTKSNLLSTFGCEDDWRIADSEKGATRVGRRRVVKVKVALAPAEDCLLSYWLQSRLHVMEISLSKAELEEPFERVFEQNGSRFELVASKIQSDCERVVPFGAPAVKCIQLYYCQVAGPGLQTISLQEELERIADFGSLNPVKVCPRLELFLSPAHKFKPQPKNGKSAAIFVLKPTAFGEIAESGHEGCGYISRDFLVELLGGGIAAERATAIQVRGAAGFGMFKGMLVAKAMEPGEPLIQVPSSMLVVGRSRSSNPEQKAFLLISRNGVHPNQTNVMLNRLFVGGETTKTFKKQESKKNLSDMILRLWKGLGVSKTAGDEYAKQSKIEEHRKHAYVVGLADPTCELPPGSVFIPKLLDHGSQIFVTRSPCIESSDGRVVPLVTSKPIDMSNENWNLLQQFPFGSILFANPKPGMTPMPVLIADGDLDGDLYFICWNKTILEQVKVKPLDLDVPYDDSKKVFEFREDWFVSAQDRMIDAQSTQLLAQIIGKLYNKAVEIAEASDDFMQNSDFHAFSKAYKESLKVGKHGGKIGLPKRLHPQFPAKFHAILTDADE